MKWPKINTRPKFPLALEFSQYSICFIQTDRYFLFICFQPNKDNYSYLDKMLNRRKKRERLYLQDLAEGTAAAFPSGVWLVG